MHLLRFVAPSENEKLEIHGHSMIFIKERNANFFYEPNLGVEFIEDDATSRIIYHLERNKKLFDLENFRFYSLWKD